MAAFEIIALNEGTPQLRAPGAGDTYVANRAVSFNIGTLTASASALSITGTYNNAGVTFPGLLQVNVSDSASGDDSLILKLQKDGVSEIAGYKDGRLALRRIHGWAGSDVIATAGIELLNDVVDFSRFTSVTPGMRWVHSGYQLKFSFVSSIAWTSSNAAAAADLTLFRDAANILAQRNGTAAQRQRVYNTFIDSSNGEWFDIDWQTTANVCTIGPRANGTGVVRPLKIVGTVLQVPPSSVTLAVNGELAIECTSNTAGNIVFRGSDGTTRRAALVFA